MNEHLGEDAELFALGVLDENERARVEAHAAVCAECSERLGKAEAVVAELASPADTKVAALPARASRRRWMAAAAAFAVAIGVTIASLLQTYQLRARLGADDAVLATIATSHFNHVTFTKVAPGAPTAKLINGRRGEWLYVIVDAPASAVHVVAERDGTRVDLGELQIHGRTSTLFRSGPGAAARVELERDGSVIETATPSYRDE